MINYTLLITIIILILIFVFCVDTEAFGLPFQSNQEGVGDGFFDDGLVDESDQVTSMLSGQRYLTPENLDHAPAVGNSGIRPSDYYDSIQNYPGRIDVNSIMQKNNIVMGEQQRRRNYSPISFPDPEKVKMKNFLNQHGMSTYNPDSDYTANYTKLYGNSPFTERTNPYNLAPSARTGAVNTDFGFYGPPTTDRYSVHKMKEPLGSEIKHGDYNEQQANKASWRNNAYRQHPRNPRKVLNVAVKDMLDEEEMKDWTMRAQF